MKKVLLLYTAVGEGHKVMAQNIGWHLKQAGYEVRLSDMARVEPGLFAKWVIPAHQFINKHLPFVWGWLYRWGHFAILPFRVVIAGLNYHHTKTLVDEYKPDLILTTQTTASAVVAYLKKRKHYSGLFGIAFSDYHFHQYWLYSGVDFYLANIEEQKQTMLRLWAGKQRVPVYICGMTLRPRPQINIEMAKAGLGIRPDERVVLVASGSLGTAMPIKWVKSLAEGIINATRSKYKVKVLILCGKNQQLLTQLAEKIHHDSIQVMGYYTPFAELCAIADIFLTKPGGMSVAEALQWNLPMLVTHWLPGQEQLNYKYLLSHGLVMSGPDDVRSMKQEYIVAQISQELETGQFRKSLFTNEASLKLVQSQPPVPAIKAMADMFHERLTP